MYGTVRVLRNIIYAAAEKGGDLNRLCAALGIRPGELNDAEKRVEGLRPIVDLWKEVVAATQDPLFGLHLGQVNNPSIFGALGYLMQSCRTLKEAYGEVVKYQQTVSGWISYDVVVGKELELIFMVNPLWQGASPETARQAVEMAMGGVWNYMYILTGKKIHPLRAELGYRSPVSRVSYEEVFKCPVAFDKAQNKVVFDGRVGDMPLISADESLYASFAQILRDKIAADGQPGRFGGQVRTVIVRDFGGKIPSLEIMAAHMNMSQRSFQRRLQQDGDTYRSLATEMKKELAVNLLQNTDATIHAISEVLGYTEPSAFHRAFKNWTSTSPARQKHLHGSSEK